MNANMINSASTRSVSNSASYGGGLKECAHDLASKAKDLITDKFGCDEDKLELSMRDSGISKDEIIAIRGTAGDDVIEVKAGTDGSSIVTVNGESKTFTAEESKRLLINGGDGNDTIIVDEDVKTGLHITGGKGDDIIVGGSGNDVIIDNHGSNRIDGGAGNDTIIAMGKDDSAHLLGRTINVLTGQGTLAQFVEGGLGDDTIITGGGNDVITDKGGSNTIHAGGGDDDITVQGNGLNRIYGENGNDTIRGGEGRDYIEGGHGNDRIFGNGGNDVIYGGKGHDYIEGGAGDDFINAGSGNDEVHGGDGNDVIFGLSGNDKLYGDAGDDVLVTGKGRDTVEGGDGFDTVRYTNGLRGRDTVLDSGEGENFAKLNPTHVPLNFFIAGNGAFRENMRDNMEAFTAIEPGQAMLKGLERSIHPVLFRATADENGYCRQLLPTGNGISLRRADGTSNFFRSLGSASVVKINPAFIDFGSIDSWSEQNTMVIMAHEMAHAYNNSTGTMDNNIYKEYSGEFVRKDSFFSGDMLARDEISGAEFQAVGLHSDKIPRANPYGMAENDYRQYFNMPHRFGYTSHVAPKFNTDPNGQQKA